MKYSLAIMVISKLPLIYINIVHMLMHVCFFLWKENLLANSRMALASLAAKVDFLKSFNIFL